MARVSTSATVSRPAIRATGSGLGTSMPSTWLNGTSASSTRMGTSTRPSQARLYCSHSRSSSVLKSVMGCP